MLPLVAFIAVTFVAPVATMLVRSVYDPVVADALPETLAALRTWDGEGLPGEAVYAAAAGELLRAREERTLGRVASRVNRVQGGLRSVLVRSVRRLREIDGGPWREALVAIDADWGDPRTWHAIRTAGDRLTARHYLNAVDLQRRPDGSIARQPEDRRIYLALFWRTFVVSFGITALCLLLGYPVAHLIAHAPPRRAGLLLALVLVAVLDVAAGPDHLLDRAAANPGRRQRPAGRGRSGRRRRPDRHDLQHDRHGGGDDPTCCCRSWCCRSIPSCGRYRRSR